MATHLNKETSQEEAALLSAPRSISLELPGHDNTPRRPANVTHLSTPAYVSPLRHHKRKVSTPHEVKETLHARSEYTNSEDDGTAIHRINQYVIKQEIGRGSFGAVHLAVDQHGKEYAVKEFSKSRLRKRAQSHVLRRPHGVPRPGHFAAGGGGFNSPLSRGKLPNFQKQEEGGNPLYLIREEIAIMKKLNHPNLVALLEVLDDPNEDSLYMVLEMCKKGVVMKVGMNEKADPYPPEDCRCWFRDLILGIEYLHAQGVVHRDIKPDNLLLTEDDVLKIVDFGVSEMFEKESDMMTAKSAGSPAFLPPELCVGKHGDISGKAADIWSMGVTLYCLHFGRVPFEKTGVLELYDSIKNDNFKIEEPCEDDFRDLMNRILEKDPAKRIKMPELRDHPWVTKGGTDPLLSFEENTSDLVEPPTEEEMNRAITGNLSNLIVVMNAVRKFKGLLRHRRPDLFEGVLGPGNRIVQPPLSMSKSELQKHTQAQKDQSARPTVEPLQREKAHSDDQHDRRATEQALAVEGVHHKIDLDSLHKPETERGGGVVRFSKVDKVYQPSPKRTLNARPHDHQSHETTQSPTHGKGQAHDPLDEFLFLQVGPAGDKGPPDPPAVSESPPAADVDIYETAYHEEIERIRQNSGSSAPKLYLTRRVDELKRYLQDEQLIGPNRKQINSGSGFMKLVQGAKDKARKERDDGPEDHVVDDNGEESSKLANLVQKAMETTKDAAQATQTGVKGALERMSTAGSEITGEGADTLAGRKG